MNEELLKEFKLFIRRNNPKLSEFYTQHDITLTNEFFKSLDYNVYLPSIDKNLQREFAWTSEMKKMYITAVVLGHPIPPITLIKITDEKTDKITYQVIDGKNRLKSIEEFLNNEFSIEWCDSKGVQRVMYYKDLSNYFNRANMLGKIEANIYYEEYESPFTDKFKLDLMESYSFTGQPQERERFVKLKNQMKNGNTLG